MKNLFNRKSLTMSESSVNLGGVPPIGTTQLGQSPIQNFKKPDISMFDNAPNDVTAGSFFGKIVLGTVVGVCVAVLLLATLTALGGLTAPDEGANPIIGVLLPVSGFIVGFVGNLTLALLYNVFFSKKYYSFGKMAGLIFASLIICLLFLFPYFLYMNNMTVLYIILGFQIIFELFIAKNLIDFLSQPNYSASSLMGNTLGLVLAVLLHMLIVNVVGADILPVTGSTFAAYVVIALGSGIWDAIYYKFYEWGNNPFYLPSLNELREERRKEEEKKAKEEEDVNVDMK